jgi:ABC-type multidrug transport system fused ATPase/permease subunit
VLIIYNFFLGFIFLKNLIYFKSNKKLIKLVFGMIIVMILEVFSIILFIIYKSTFLQNFLSSLRFRLYNMYTNQDYKSFIEKDTPEIIRNIHVETTVTMRSLDAYLNIFAESFILVGFIFFLFFLAPLPTLIITLAFFLFFLIYIFLLKKKIFELGKERVELDSDLIREIEQGLGNYKEIIIYNIKNIFLNRFFEYLNSLV